MNGYHYVSGIKTVPVFVTIALIATSCPRSADVVDKCSGAPKLMQLSASHLVNVAAIDVDRHVVEELNMRIVLDIQNGYEDASLVCLVGVVEVYSASSRFAVGVLRTGRDQSVLPGFHVPFSVYYPMPSDGIVPSGPYSVVWWPVFVEFSDQRSFRFEMPDLLDGVSVVGVDWWACP